MDQDAIGMEVGLGPGDFVLDGDPAPSPQKGHGASKFSAHVYCGQTVGWIKMALGTEVGISPGDFVLDGDPAPYPKRGRSLPSQFSAHFYCRQTAGCIKMPLGMEVGLSAGVFLLNGDPAPPPHKGGGAEPPIFGPCLLWSTGYMDQHATWYGGRPRPTRHCVRWGPSSHSPKGGRSPFPNFRPMFIVAKRLDGSKWHLAWMWALAQTTLC